MYFFQLVSSEIVDGDIGDAETGRSDRDEDGVPSLVGTGSASCLVTVTSPLSGKSSLSSEDTHEDASSSISGSGSPSTDSPDSPVPSELTFSSSVSSLDIDSFLGPAPSAHPPALKTYKLVGDNLDKNVRPRDMRSDYQGRSLHYFHTYAVRDRVDLTNVSDVQISPDLSAIDLTSLLPTAADRGELENNFAVLIARVLRKHMPFFAKFGKGVERHIQHEFAHEMSLKSEVVRICAYVLCTHAIVH